MIRGRRETPEGAYYRRGFSSLAFGALLMTAGVAAEFHGTGSMPAAKAVAVTGWGLLAVVAAGAAVFMTAYTRSVPALLKMSYRRRQGSLAGWNGYRAAADASAAANARTGLGRLLVRSRSGTWTSGGDISGLRRTHRSC